MKINEITCRRQYLHDKEDFYRKRIDLDKAK